MQETGPCWTDLTMSAVPSPRCGFENEGRDAFLEFVPILRAAAASIELFNELRKKPTSSWSVTWKCLMYNAWFWGYAHEIFIILCSREQSLICLRIRPTLNSCHTFWFYGGTVLREHWHVFPIVVIISNLYFVFFLFLGLTGEVAPRWSRNGSTRGAKLASNCFIGALADAREPRDRTSHNSIRPTTCNRRFGSKLGFIALWGWGGSWSLISLFFPF